MDSTGVVREEILDNDTEDQLRLPIPKPESRGESIAAPLVQGADDLASSNTAPSTPPRSDPALFSDGINHKPDRESPPSSPPPLLSSPPLPARKPAFSFLKRKKSAREDAPLCSPSEPLSHMTPNVVKLPRPAKKPRLRQMQIDLGGEVRRTCPTCGMEYIPSNKEDAALHKEFHGINVGGVDLGKGFLKDPCLTNVPSSRASLRDGETIVAVDRRSSESAKNKARKVLAVVNTELSAAEVDDEQLWEGIESSAPAPKIRLRKKRKANRGAADNKGDRFKVFLYLDGDKCVGFCLAEKISSACRVVKSKAGEKNSERLLSSPKSSSISYSPTPDVALLGISRIWTSKSYRGRGIAIDLLDCVRGNFFYGMEVPKDLVAFSQPTESGGRLATRWYQAESGWLVYTEGQRETKA
ncbi:N-acetyltransferase O1 (Establishment of cohesion protein 1) [Pseudocyphellaria aurata]|nr:N-acetyltransferase O1 (Establishment of cohesion protein 1) [Pseudocyphellaria aurata]